MTNADASSVMAPSAKPKPGPKHPAGDNEQEEDRLDAGGAGAEHSQTDAYGGEYAEQGH